MTSYNEKLNRIAADKNRVLLSRNLDVFTEVKGCFLIALNQFAQYSWAPNATKTLLKGVRNKKLWEIKLEIEFIRFVTLDGILRKTQESSN